MDNKAKLCWLESKILASAEFLTVHRTMLEAHLVDFITYNEWENCVHPLVGEECLRLTNQEWFDFLKHCFELASSENTSLSECTPLTRYVTECLKLTLPFLGVCEDITNVVQYHGDTRRQPKEFDKFTSEKKMHEVQRMAAAIASLACKTEISDVVDIGSGKGYLGSFLALHYQLQVLGIDSSSSNSSGAIKQNKRLKKSWQSFEQRAENRSEALAGMPPSSSSSSVPAFSGNVGSQTVNKSNNAASEETMRKGNKNMCKKSKNPSASSNSVACCEASDACQPTECTNGSFTPLTVCINWSTTIKELSSAAGACSQSVGSKNMLVGLHTCGDLTPIMMKMYSCCQQAQILFTVSCCYNLIEEQFCRNSYWKNGDSLPEEFGFPLSEPLQRRTFYLGQNPRMVACESLDRIMQSRTETAQHGVFYRALLQVFLKDKGIELKADQHVGRIAAKCPTFDSYVRKALQRLGIDGIQVDENELEQYLIKYDHYSRKLDAFFHLRATLSPVVEGLILMDRLYYLIAKNPESTSYLVRLFDPVVSPRCYALISLKKKASS